LKKALLKQLRIAIKIELTTIPLYLYSMYSLKFNRDDDLNYKAGVEARNRILTVVHQEMLHLALAGNLYKSIAGSSPGPVLYSARAIPKYGDDHTILKTKIPLRLERCQKSNLECFLKIEAPYEEPSSAQMHLLELDGTDKYASIGQFYANIEKLLLSCGPTFPFENPKKQFSKAEFFPETMVQIVDKSSAQKALQTIIDQGEGSVGVQEAHYQMFLDLYHRRKQWNCWPVKTSPKTADYAALPFVEALSQAFNAAYCYLLITIEKTWRVKDAVIRRKLVGNIHPLMIDVLTPLALVLVKQPLNREENAGPSFEFYPVAGSKEEESEGEESEGEEGEESEGEEKKAAPATLERNSQSELLQGARRTPTIDSQARALYDAIKKHVGEALGRREGEPWKEELERVQFSLGPAAWPVR
jgi:hypothetical protein